MKLSDNPFRSPPSSAATANIQPSEWYGWVHVGLGAAAMVGTLPGRTHGLGIITEPLLRDLQLDKTLYADINAWATLLGAGFCWPAGILLDRLGVRRVLSAIALALGVTVIAMTLVSRPMALFVAIAMSRALGQSMLSVASLALVGKSFGNRLGLAMGTYSLLVGLGFGAAFKATGEAVLVFGWRPTWAAIGAMLILGLTPVAWFFVRDRKLSATEPQRVIARRTAGADFTLGQALRSYVFWVFAVASSIYGLISSGIALFNQAILNERGFDAETYHTVLAVSSICGMAANLLGGWAAGRVGLGRLLAASMISLAGALAALPQLTELWQVYAYAVTLGAAGGIVTVSFFTVWGLAFGRSHLGKIQGWAQMMTVIASAAGPKVFAEWQAHSGSYVGAFYLFVPVAMALAVAAWMAKLPSSVAEPAAPVRTDEELQLAST
jgi:MFS family permease